MSVDVKRGQKLPIVINMTFPALPCAGEARPFNTYLKYQFRFFSFLLRPLDTSKIVSHDQACPMMCSPQSWCHRYVRQAWGRPWHKYLESKSILPLLGVACLFVTSLGEQQGRLYNLVLWVYNFSWVSWFPTSYFLCGSYWQFVCCLFHLLTEEILIYVHLISKINYWECPKVQVIIPLELPPRATA